MVEDLRHITAAFSQESLYQQLNTNGFTFYTDVIGESGFTTVEQTLGDGYKMIRLWDSIKKVQDRSPKGIAFIFDSRKIQADWCLVDVDGVVNMNGSVLVANSLMNGRGYDEVRTLHHIEGNKTLYIGISNIEHVEIV